MTSWYYELPEAVADGLSDDRNEESSSVGVAVMPEPASDAIVFRTRPTVAFAPGLAAFDAISALVNELTLEIERSQEESP